MEVRVLERDLPEPIQITELLDLPTIKVLYVNSRVMYGRKCFQSHPEYPIKLSSTVSFVLSRSS